MKIKKLSEAIDMSNINKNMKEPAAKDAYVNMDVVYGDAQADEAKAEKDLRTAFDELDKNNKAAKVPAVTEPKTTVKNYATEKHELTEAKFKEPEDLWTKVWNELDAGMDPQDCKREIKAKKGQRYQQIYTDLNGNISVDAHTEEALGFAKQVAEHYGVEIKIKKSPYSHTDYNKYYPWTATLIIPEEGVNMEVKEDLTSAKKIEESNGVREYTTQIIDMLDNETESFCRNLAKDLLNYMSEDDVKDFAISEGYLEE